MPEAREKTTQDQSFSIFYGQEEGEIEGKYATMLDIFQSKKC